MLRPPLKYSSLRNYLFVLGLTLYLTYSFQSEIYDGLHILSHQLSGGYTHHTHQIDKEPAKHEHQLLSKLKNVISAHHKPPITQQKKMKYSTVDKSYHLSFIAQRTVWEERSEELFINDQRLPTSPFLRVITPPPQASIKGLTIKRYSIALKSTYNTFLG